ncbi:MAG: zinc ribbon domain-containing protein [Lachnospiraceae bacterium]|nr:zinc ribbon domain-containing protein [Lachnospiraceae bacterium]
MSIIICPECGKEISDLSETCVNCGFPVRKHAQKTPQAGLCKACGCQNEVDAVYCKQCGVEIHENCVQINNVQSDNTAIVYEYENRKLWAVVMGCLIHPFVGIILMWVLKKPRKIEWRVLATILCVLLMIVSVNL